MRYGRKVPSVSTYTAFPFPPPMRNGSWHVTHSVWAICVLPVRNSPNAYVIDRLSTPPPSNWSSAVLPVEMWIIWLRCCKHTLPVIKPTSVILRAASIIFYTFTSDNPLIWDNYLLHCIWIPGTVKIPACFSFMTSAAAMPCYVNRSISINDCPASYSTLPTLLPLMPC